MRPRRSLTVALPLLVLLNAGCGSSEPSGSPAEESSSAAAQTTITAEDLAAYERGIMRETEAVRAAQREAAAAADPQARGRALQAQFETATIPLGAEASGLTESRYRAVRLVVHDILRTLDMQGKIDGPMSMDLSRADEATKTRLSRDAFADLPADSAATLREAVPRLAPAWIEYVTLTAVAG